MFILVRSNTESCIKKKVISESTISESIFFRAKWGQKWVEMRRCQHDFYLDIKVMTCHSSLVLPSSSSATCSAWELSLGRNHGTFFGFKLPRGFLRCWGISGVCMPTNYKVTITIVINHHLPTLFLLLHQKWFKNSMVADSAFSKSWMPVTVHWSWSYQPIIWSY